MWKPGIWFWVDLRVSTEFMLQKPHIELELTEYFQYKFNVTNMLALDKYCLYMFWLLSIQVNVYCGLCNFTYDPYCNNSPHFDQDSFLSIKIRLIICYGVNREWSELLLIHSSMYTVCSLQ